MEVFGRLATESQDASGDALRARYRYGLLYGMVAGVAFAVTTWGVDGALLAASHAYFPWLKLLLGGIGALLVGFVAGWLTGRLERTGLVLLLWLLVGVIYGWLAGHVPFEGASWLLVRLNPRLAGLVRYPFSEGPYYRLVVAMVVTVGVSAFGGLLVMSLIESTSQAETVVGRWFPVAVWILMFGVAGSTANGMMNEPLRNPVLAMDRTIQFVLDNEGTTISPKQAREWHVGALTPVRSLLHRPRRLLLASYDDTIVMTDVLVNFDGGWVRCSVTAEVPGACASLP